MQTIIEPRPNTATNAKEIILHLLPSEVFLQQQHGQQQEVQ